MTRALALLIGLTAVVAAACGSGNSASGAVDATFRTTATTACAGALSQASLQPFPWEQWNPDDPLVSQLPAVGTYLDNEPINRRAHAFLQALGTPKKGTQSWQKFVDLVGQQQDIMADQISSAKAANKPAFLDSVHRIKALTPQIDAAGKTAGFAKTSSCVQLFG